MRHRWIVKVILQCALLVIFVRPEEVFNTTPPPFESNFSCYGRSMGFYADVESDCKIYYTCDDYGNRFVYRCPQETAFRQDALICDHAHLVDCRRGVDRSAERRENRSRLSTTSLESTDDHRSYSRSFHVVRQPDDSHSTSTQSRAGFVLSASLYLKDRDSARSAATARENVARTQQRPQATIKDDGNSKRVANVTATTTVGPPRDTSAQRFPAFRNDRVPSRELSPPGTRLGSGSFTALNDTRKPEFSTTTRAPLVPKNTQRATSESSSRNADYYRYSETLRSIQANGRETTSEIPVYALTMSLKPLVPNELEYDPYYPKMPTTTEAYYTPVQRGKGRPTFRTSTPPTWKDVHFEIPAVLPDLNTLQDLVDRRKLFYIPRVKSG